MSASRRGSKNFQDQSSEIQRIWICGPPIMEESFDKMLPDIA
jgi:Na+-transporting NADH:ubiquinone oxidoreductase subunit NqrF